VLCHLEAIAALQAHGLLNVNVTLLIEGEEEIGSDHLFEFVEKYADDLRADLCVISDTSMLDRHTPSITTGLRGLLYEEIVLTGASHDLHSGSYGGAVPNPANVLAQIIAAMHDTQGRVTIPGFYDGVAPLTDEEKQQMNKLPFDEARWLKDLHIPFSSGESHYSILERTSTRPTLDVNGLTSGYQGEGAKTVLPSVASAKVSMRLVPGQDPTLIRQQFEMFVRSRVPENVKLELRNFGQASAVVTPIDSQAVRIGARALEQVFGKSPVMIRGGGTIPVISAFKEHLGVDSLMIGFGLPDDRVHSPNEKFDLACFYGGCKTAAVLYHQLQGLALLSHD
jgi:acetylornithine deacetylase/succinyl-diaminopimelate desuccinylase-like protein